MHRLSVIARFLMVFGIIPLVFGSAACFALGFGPSKLHSYLNEPLNLDIELIDAETQSMDNLTASLASVDDFKRAEMQRPYFLSRLRFEVKRMGRRSYINVTSPDAIKQPFLDFLVDLSWPGGHSVKGYTILLDPTPITSARSNAIPNSALINHKNDVNTGDRQNMESLFGPEDKTQIPVSPKIETVSKERAPQEQSAVKQPDASVANIPNLSAQTDAISNEQRSNLIDNKHKSENSPLNPNTNAHISHPSDQRLSSKKFLPVHHKLAEKSLPFWLFWTSVLAMLCIVSLTIWLLNKYRLAKPKPRSNNAYFAIKGNHEKKNSQGIVDTHRGKTEPSVKATTEPEPSLKEELRLKLVLAGQYIAVNDPVTAKKLLDEVIEQGNDQQKAEAENLSLKMGIND